MKQVLVILCLAALLAVAAGCSQPAPEAPSQPVVTPAKSAPVTAQTSGAAYVPATTVPAPAKTSSISGNTITIKKNQFNPAELTVKAGSTIRWVNSDDHPHRIEFSNKAFTSSTFLLAAGQSFSQQFPNPGTYEYNCMIHQGMQGVITVE